MATATRGHKFSYRHSLSTAEFPGSHYDADEVEWLKAIAKFQQEQHRRQLDCRDVLGLARSLGYRKVPEIGEGHALQERP